MRILIIAFLIYLLYRLVKGLKGLHAPRRPPGEGRNGEVIDEMVKDPNCGTYIPQSEAVRRRVRGEEHFFCSESCAEEYAGEGRGES